MAPTPAITSPWPSAGVDKITFQRLNYDSAGCKFLSVTNQFVDSYVTNGVLQHQLLERVITLPDILFTVKTTNYDNLYDRTGTSNWVNNGLPSHDGRGVIQPPVAITFNPLGPSLYHYGPTYTPATFLTDQDVFASFDGTTNPPIAYPITLAVTNSTAFHFWLITSYAIDGSSVYHHYSWNLPGQAQRPVPASDQHRPDELVSHHIHNEFGSDFLISR